MADQWGPSIGVRVTEVSLIRMAVIERFHFNPGISVHSGLYKVPCNCCDIDFL